jgi:hypothetical protein
MVQGQPGQKVHETPSQRIARHVVHAYHPSYYGSIEENHVPYWPGNKHETLSQK